MAPRGPKGGDHIIDGYPLIFIDEYQWISSSLNQWISMGWGRDVPIAFRSPLGSKRSPGFQRLPRGVLRVLRAIDNREHPIPMDRNSQSQWIEIAKNNPNSSGTKFLEIQENSCFSSFVRPDPIKLEGMSSNIIPHPSHLPESHIYQPRTTFIKVS